METTALVLLIVFFFIGVLLNSLLLFLTTKLFKTADQSFKSAIMVAGIVGIANLVFGFVRDGTSNFGIAAASLLGNLGVSLLGFISISGVLAVALLKKIYTLDLGKTMLIWLVWTSCSLVITFIAGIVIGVLIVASGYPYGIFG